MSFVNPEVDIAALPRFDGVRLNGLNPAYPRVVLILAAAVETPLLLVALLFTFLVPPIPVPFRLLIAIAVLGTALAIGWLAHAHACSIRYAVRRHDVILRSGVFWKTESVQPIKRIQHVEQAQGPVDKRFGLSTLKLYSAGTGRATFEIPGLDADTAAAISRFILAFHEPETGAAPPREEGDGERAIDG